MTLTDIKKKYTKIEKKHDQLGESFYVLLLKIDQQSFMVGRDFTTGVSIKWWQKQLAKALKRLIETNSLAGTRKAPENDHFKEVKSDSTD